MRWLSRRNRRPSSSDRDKPEESFEVGGDRIVFWKAKEQVDGEDYGPVWIADANDPDVTLEEPDLWVELGPGGGVRAEARSSARGRMTATRRNAPAEQRRLPQLRRI